VPIPSPNYSTEPCRERRRPEHRRRRRLAGGALLTAAPALAALCATGGSALASGRARAAHTLRASENASLHLVKSNGSQIVEQGSVSGTLSGSIKAQFHVGPTITGSVTLYVHGGGTITGRGSGHLHNAHGHIFESFSGSFSVTGGSGRYGHASGHSGFYGTINRRTDAMQVQTRGTLSY
jgi:hypothetical protein